jgi:1-acyl-sn-glycerol-3-phosphate acyltransferase
VILRDFTRRHNDPERFWLYGRALLKPMLERIAPSAVYGIGRIPVTGGAVLAANHFTGIDPPLIGVNSTRTIYFMAKAELLESWAVEEVLRRTGTFTVRRGESDRDALRVARWLVREGHLVGMFVEGTRQRFGYPGPAQAGAPMVALQEQVPVVPCGIDTFQWSFRNPRRCCVVWGEPLRFDGIPPTGRGYKEAADVIQAEVLGLWRQAAEAVAAGLPDRLADGTLRSRAPAPEGAFPVLGARPWPIEEWARGPLGPFFNGRSG